MSVIFVGHGSPMNAIEENEFVLGWKQMSKKISKPKGIISISAHWLTRKTAITFMETPKIIYDFYGFPKELYEVKYPAKGNPALAKKLTEEIKSVEIILDESEWGLDHGTWSVLKIMYPDADIPVIQIGINPYLPLEKHVEIGKELKKYNEEGYLIMGSGNIVHNLREINFYDKEYSWAVDFDNYIKESLNSHDLDALINYKNNKYANLAHPTNEHYIPLLYSIGASDYKNIEFFNEKVFAGSISMRSILFTE